MSNPILLIACLLAICIPIISVQLPRTSFFAHFRSKHPEERRSSIHFQPPPLRRRSQPDIQTDGTSNSGSSGHESKESMSPPQAIERLTRKPWDPPFPTRAASMERKSGWHDHPPSAVRSSGREMEERGSIKGLLQPSLDSEDELEFENQDTTPERDLGHRAHKKNRLGCRSIFWTLIGVLAILLFILAFAILIAHCLAWFLVYKTEARLGEARRGLLKGGEMRLCLCAA